MLTLLVLTTYLLAICIYSREYHDQNKVHATNKRQQTTMKLSNWSEFVIVVLEIFN